MHYRFLDQKNADKIVLLVDSSLVQSFINRQTIQDLSSSLKVIHFNAPFAALRYLINQSRNLSSFPDVILMDINVSKKEIEYFMKQFDAFPSEIKSKCKIHLISLAFGKEDKDWINSIPQISSCLEKPLISEHCIEILTRVY